MSIRRTLLILLLIALAVCAAAGCLAMVTSATESVFGVIASTVMIAVAIGLLLPLTLLLDRPRFRPAAMVSIAVILIALAASLMMTWVGILGFGFRGADVFAIWLGFTLLIGVPAAGATFLFSFPWARAAVWTLLCLAAFAYALCLLGTVLYAISSASSGGSEADQWASHIWATGLIPYGIGAIGAVLLVNVGQHDRRYFRWPAIACAGVAALYAVGLEWAEPERRSWYRAQAILILVPAILAHTNLVLMAKMRANLRWLVLLTLAAGYVTGFFWLLVCFLKDAEVLARAATVFTTATLCTSLALVVLAFFNRKTGVPNLASTPMSDMDLTCPRCGERQTLPLGDSICKACELRISISVVEPRCPGCGYLLFRLTSERCPECGAVVRERKPESPAPLPSAPPAERVIRALIDG